MKKEMRKLGLHRETLRHLSLLSLEAAVGGLSLSNEVSRCYEGGPTRNEGSAASAMLAQTGLATAENWTFGDGFIERLRYEIDPRWQGEIPRTVLIARCILHLTCEALGTGLAGWAFRIRTQIRKSHSDGFAMLGWPLISAHAGSH